MGAFAAGQVVLVRFPFSDLSATKLRPAVVLAGVGRGDCVLCQVTSNPYGDRDAVKIAASDFDSGSLHRQSYARPGKLFTAHISLIVKNVATFKSDKAVEVRDAVIRVIREG